MSNIVLLDGGMGQELLARSKNKPSPLWSAQVLMDEPDIVEAVHRDYFDAGARVLTLNTYSATPERLARDASEDLFEPLQARAVAIGKAVQADTQTKIAGCLPPLFGSYHPEMAPDYETCLNTYRRVVTQQKDHVDVFLCETMSSIKEIETATLAAVESGLSTWCAVSVSDTDGTRLRSGEPLEEGVATAKKCGAEAVLINCSTPEAISQGIPIVVAAGVVFGAYANGFVKADDLQLGGTVDVLSARVDLTPAAYADYVMAWVGAGATLVGGCCEVGPAHIHEIARRLESAGHTITGSLQ